MHHVSLLVPLLWRLPSHIWEYNRGSFWAFGSFPVLSNVSIFSVSYLCLPSGVSPSPPHPSSVRLSSPTSPHLSRWLTTNCPPQYIHKLSSTIYIYNIYTTNCGPQYIQKKSGGPTPSWLRPSRQQAVRPTQINKDGGALSQIYTGRGHWARITRSRGTEPDLHRVRALSQNYTGRGHWARFTRGGGTQSEYIPKGPVVCFVFVRTMKRTMFTNIKIPRQCWPSWSLHCRGMHHCNFHSTMIFCILSKSSF